MANLVPPLHWCFDLLPKEPRVISAESRVARLFFVLVLRSTVVPLYRDYYIPQRS